VTVIFLPVEVFEELYRQQNVVQQEFLQVVFESSLDFLQARVRVFRLDWL
jgi:hypothetical protein